MASLDPSGYELDLEGLDTFLSSERTADNCMQISDLDGFLTAIAVGPARIPSEEWLGVVWGDDAPAFASFEEKQRIVGAILARYNEIVAAAAGEPEDVAPILWEDPDGNLVADDWAFGFMEGVALRSEAWAPLFHSEEDQSIIAPIAILLGELDDQVASDDDAEALDEARQEAAALLPSCVILLNDYWRDQGGEAGPRGRGSDDRPEPRRPCACGSGRPYERCCGAH